MQCWDMFFNLSLLSLLPSVEQMKAKNKWGLYLVEGESVTVSCSFILREKVYPKPVPQSNAGSQKLVTCLSELGPGSLVTAINVTVV